MRNSTPFFAAFGSLLFGPAPRSRLQKLLGQWPQRPSINQYMETFGEFIPQTLLARSKEKVNSRQRIFSPLVTFWAFLAQVLERGSSCRDALQRISAWWQLHFPDQGSPSSDTSGYCQARARLDEAVLQQIGTQVAEQLERQVTNEQLWLGRRVKIVDGTGLSMPDTAANQLQWPQNSGQKPGCGFPQLKVVGLFCLHSGALLEVAHDDKHHHDITLARRLWHLLQPGEKSFSSPRCSIRSFIQSRNWKNSISGAGTSNCISDRSKPCLAWMSCAASPPGWFSKSWRCIGSLTISFAP